MDGEREREREREREKERMDGRKRGERRGIESGIKWMTGIEGEREEGGRGERRGAKES